MSQRFIGGALLAACAVLLGADAGRAQDPADSGPIFEYPITIRAQAPANIGFDPPLNTEPVIPIPTGAAGSAGFYATAEYVMLTQTRALGEQTQSAHEQRGQKEPEMPEDEVDPEDGRDRQGDEAGEGPPASAALAGEGDRPEKAHGDEQ